jgi:hypothetical protein
MHRLLLLKPMFPVVIQRDFKPQDWPFPRKVAGKLPQGRQIVRSHLL